MKSAISIRSFKDLRTNYFIMEQEAKLVYTHLAQAADDLKLGKVQNIDEAFDDILLELDGLES